MPVRLQAQAWTNTALSASQRAGLLLGATTFSQKTAMINGAGGSYVGNLPASASPAIPALNLQDGPAGIGDGVSGVTAFPAPIALAASWDVPLARQYGVMLGSEAWGKGVEVLLGPMMNMARAYEDGRNFEGYGESPELSGAMAAAEINGLQSQGIIATAKHFVCYEEETDRMYMTADVDERTRQEIYYLPFLDSVRAGAGAVMASYNRVNSRYACESQALNATLKKQWGFNGFVMSDWGASFSTVPGMNNGLDMDMYNGFSYTASDITTANSLGNVPASELNGMVLRILTAMFQFGIFDNPPAGNLSSSVTNAAHQQFALDAAEEGMALLQNNGSLLPLGPSVQSIAVIGSGASVSPISTGGGSASVNLPYNVTPLAGITSRAGTGITVSYAQGDGASVAQAVQLAASSDVAIVCVGQQTSEGSDRTNLSLPDGQDALVEAVAAANPNTIVVMYESSATLMPWANQVAAILMAWYPGQENGNALAHVLFGDVNPSGKLPVTIPPSASQVPTSTLAQWPGVNGHTAYSEGLQIGYRWYDANNVAPLFPFGFGLSYTTFAYSNLTVSAVSPSGQVQIGFDLNNTGALTGAEVPQLYLGFPGAAGEPPKLLKGFQKIMLSPGQTQHVTFNLNWEDLANWDATARGWIITPGVFQVMVGASSRDIRLTGNFTVNSIPSSDRANAALLQPVTVSSAMSASTPGSAAVDGDPTTAWTSLAADPQWIAVDLGVIKDLSRVRLLWNTNYATSYQIQISTDDTNWTSVYTTINGSGGTEDLLVSGRGRYVQMYGTQRAGAGGYALSEFDVFSQPQRPFGGVVPTLPGRIEAANYDTGGEGVAYYNTTVGNPGGAYRSDDVGIQLTSDTGGGYNVGWLDNGEWLEYTVNPPDPSAIYSISVRVAAPAAGGQLRVRLNGTVLRAVSIPNTGGYQNWQTVTLPNVPVQGGIGSQALRLEVLNNGFNIHWIELDRVEICGTNDIALNQPSSASSLQSGRTYPASAAFDENPTTRWSSAFSDPQWIQVDLGSVQNIARVWLNWENAFAQDYSIQLSSDGSTWTTVYTTTNGPGSINDLAALGSGRYVQMYGTVRGTSYGYSLWEFEVFPALAPEPTIALNGTNVVICWPNSATSWSLQTATTLGLPGDWSTVTTVPLLLNSVNIVTNAVSVPAQFYRLEQNP
ncbi:MAG: glycoside hydrolase family 3 C-terminal domain-containing protein [Verrucomicrobiota bacterium]|jgi:beta-glucosidase